MTLKVVVALVRLSHPLAMVVAAAVPLVGEAAPARATQSLAAQSMARQSIHALLVAVVLAGYSRTAEQCTTLPQAPEEGWWRYRSLDH